MPGRRPLIPPKTGLAVLNLAVWFAAHALFPRPGASDWFAAFLAILAFFATQHFKVRIISVIVECGLAGFLYRLLLGG